MTLAVKRYREAGRPGLYHLRTAEMRHLPAGDIAGLWPRGNPLGQNLLQHTEEIETLNPSV